MVGLNNLLLFTIIFVFKDASSNIVAPHSWGYSALLETESVLPCLFFVWDNAAPKVMPVRLVLFWVI